MNQSTSESFWNLGYCRLRSVVDVTLASDFINVLSEVALKVADKLGLEHDYKNVSDVVHKLIPEIYSANARAGSFIYDYFNKHHLVYSLYNNSVILDALSEIFCCSKSHFVIDNFQFFINLPSQDRQVLGWHQDSSYFKFFSPQESAVLWMPLVDVDENNGALSIIPGSHKFGILDHVSNATGSHKDQPRERRGLSYVSTDLFDASLEQKVPVKFGDLAVFHMNLIHQGGLNHSDKVRFNLISRIGNMVHSNFESRFLQHDQSDSDGLRL